MLYCCCYKYHILVNVLILANIDPQDFRPRDQPNKKLLLFKVAKNILMVWKLFNYCGCLSVRT